MTLSPAQVQALRGLPINFVRAALEGEGYALKAAPAGMIRNAIDVAMRQAGLTFAEAKAKLAWLFPDAVAAGERVGFTSFQETYAKARQVARERGKRFKELGTHGMRIARDLVKWWSALGLESIDPHIFRDDSLRAGPYPACKPIYAPGKLKNSDLYDTIRLIPMLQAAAAKGETEKAPVAIFCAPHWRENQVGIMMDDVFTAEHKDFHKDFIKKFPPTAIVATSDRSCQVFWVLWRRFSEPGFYSDFIKHINREYHGDPKIMREGWDTRIGGFFNQKKFMQDGSGKTPWVHIKESSTRYPREMDEMCRVFHEKWIKEREEPKTFTPKRGTPTRVLSRDAPEEKPWSPFIPAGGLSFESQYAALRLVELPGWVLDLGLSFQEYFRNRPPESGREYSRSETDYVVCKMLHDCGCYPDEIFSFQWHHGLQDDTPVLRRHSDGSEFMAVRVPKSKRDHVCRNVVCNASRLIPDSSRNKRPDVDLWDVYRKIMPSREHREVMARLDEMEAALRLYDEILAPLEEA